MNTFFLNCLNILGNFDDGAIYLPPALYRNCATGIGFLQKLAGTEATLNLLTRSIILASSIRIDIMTHHDEVDSWAQGEKIRFDIGVA